MMETRALQQRLSNEGKQLVGIVPYNSDSTVLSVRGKPFIEHLKPGVFDTSIKARDITLHYTHDKNTRPPLGRTSAGTLRLSGKDDIGLRFWNDSPEWASDIRESVARGDVHGVSFGMNVLRDEWNRRPDGMATRAVHEAELDHIAIVLSPAYGGSSLALRSEVEIPARLLDLAEIEIDCMEILMRINR